jgi:hypothetical protein
MAISHSLAVAQAATNAVVDLIDGGAGDNGTLEILDGATVLVTIDLEVPAFGAADGSADAALELGTGLSAVAGETGVADGFKFKDKAGTEILRGVVATSGADMDIDNTSINAGQIVSVDSYKYNAGQAIIA